MSDSPDSQGPRPPGKVSRRLLLAGVATGAAAVAAGLAVNAFYVYEIWRRLDATGGDAEPDAPQDMQVIFGPVHYSQMIAIGVTLVGMAVLAVSLFALPRKGR